MDLIDKNTLKHLADLARIKINEKDEENLLKSLRSILSYFEELKGVDTSNVEPVDGGVEADFMNVFREDESRKNSLTGNGVDSFPSSKNGFLEIPSIFENKE
jgi:aspartyl-tRNA(Asn)/glutamyl-tRNA(Gln) amidotransferase subunit C